MSLGVALRPVAALGHHVRAATRVAPGRPALWIGLRMAAATAVPLALTPWLDPVTATAAPLTGYFITLVDKGGAYRTRATSMAVAALGTLLAVVVGSLVAGTWLAGPVVIAGLTACAFAHLWGATGASIGNPIAIMLAVTCFRRGLDADITASAVGVVLGASWAMVLALVVWPVRVYQPGRRAIANVLAELADQAATAAEPGNRDELVARHRTLRERLELARQTLVATRRGRGERDRGERLLALVHVCDRIFGKLLALEELLEALVDPDDAAISSRALHAHAVSLYRLADLVLVEHPSPLALTEVIHVAPRTRSEHLHVLHAGLADEIALAGTLIASLADDEHLAARDLELVDRVTIRERLREAFDLDSAVLRHALRVLISTTVAVLIASELHPAFGYWIIITAFILLQPHRSATTTRLIQRVLGTVGGAIIAVVLAAIIPQQIVLVAITIAFAAIGASVLQLNYGLFSLFVTPTFVLLAEVQTADFTLFEVRVLYTLFGGAIAFLASTVLWPARERAVFDDLLAEAIECAAHYLAAVQHAIATRAPRPSSEILAARRAFGLALGNAELALERVIAERAPTDVVEPRLTSIAVARRLGGAINVLGATRALATHDPDREALAQHAAAIAVHLHELATSLRDQRPPAPPQPSSPALDDTAAAFMLHRLDLHLASLTSTVARAAPGH